MASTEEARVKNILQDFIHDSIPEYIMSGSHAIIENEGVQKLNLKKREGFWDVEGQVQGEDFQVYSSELGVNLKDGGINFYCNCPDSFSGVCRHIGATALKLMKTISGTGKSKDEEPTA